MDAAKIFALVVLKCCLCKSIVQFDCASNAQWIQNKQLNCSYCASNVNVLDRRDTVASQLN
jgi:hypothetical protein